MTHRIMLRIKNTSTIGRNSRDFPTKEDAQNLIQKINHTFGKDSGIVLSIQRY